MLGNWPQLASRFAGTKNKAADVGNTISPLLLQQSSYFLTGVVDPQRSQDMTGQGYDAVRVLISTVYS